MTGHTLWNGSSEAGYENYIHNIDNLDPGHIGIGMVFTRLTTTYQYIFSQLSSGGALINQNGSASAPSAGAHYRVTNQGGGGDFDIVITNLTLTNVSDFDEQVQINQRSTFMASNGTQYVTNSNTIGNLTFGDTASSSSGDGYGTIPRIGSGDTIWIPRYTSLVLYTKSSPLYSTMLPGQNKWMQMKTVANTNSIDLVCCYSILHQSKS